MSYLLASPATEEFYHFIGIILAFLVCLTIGGSILYLCLMLIRWVFGVTRMLNYLDTIAARLKVRETSTTIPDQLKKTDQKLKTLQETQNDIRTLLNSIEKNTTPDPDPPNSD